VPPNNKFATFIQRLYVVGGYEYPQLAFMIHKSYTEVVIIASNNSKSPNSSQVPHSLELR
jgi:hypothetical protein